MSRIRRALNQIELIAAGEDPDDIARTWDTTLEDLATEWHEVIALLDKKQARLVSMIAAGWKMEVCWDCSPYACVDDCDHDERVQTAIDTLTTSEIT